MSLPLAFGGTLQCAPVGTDPRDTEQWADLGSLLEASIATWEPPPPPSGAEVLHNVRAAMQMIADAPYRPSWGGGVELVPSPHMQRGSVIVTSGPAKVVVPDADYREFNEAEYAGIVARRIVRHGFAETYSDLEQWDGPVGPAPEDPLPVAFKFFARTMVREPAEPWWMLTNLQRMTEPGEPL